MAEMNYTVHEQLNLIELRPLSEVNVEDICAYGNRLVDQGIMRDGTIEFVDMSDITGLTVSYASARDLADFHNRWLSAGWFGSFYYTPKDSQFGIVRMVRAIVECIPNSPTGMMVPCRKRIPLEEARDFISKHIGDPLEG